MRKYLYLIPARGGSKGIPGKNIKPLAGVPLIAHTIRQALQVADSADVVVSTDDPAIAATAREHGASVPFMRPAELATDTASSRSVIIDALERMKASGRDYEAVVLLQPTSPLRTADDIRRTITAFEDSRQRFGEDRGAEMAVTVSEARTNPYYSAFETDDAGFLHISKGDGRYTRRQDAPKVWEFNGAVYVIDADALRRDELSRLSRTLPVEMPASRSIDLDTPADWARAEAAMRELTPLQ
ncbi:MAG: acylneuraminate cytidylyltransferase family protein [Muribaculaceae bacterium]|nr:acylneuraminate cytidylyltransferase family protein [Muribaculaceae bacterium]